MNDEPAWNKSESQPRRPLEERLAQRPAVLARLHQLVDTLEASVGDGCDAHRAEERVIEEMRRLGQETLSQWAQEVQEHTQAQVRATHPAASRHGKKKP